MITHQIIVSVPHCPQNKQFILRAAGIARTQGHRYLTACQGNSFLPGGFEYVSLCLSKKFVHKSEHE